MIRPKRAGAGEPILESVETRGELWWLKLKGVGLLILVQIVLCAYVRARVCLCARLHVKL